LTIDSLNSLTANQLTLRKLLTSLATIQLHLYTMTGLDSLNGLPQRSLHIVIHGFVFLKFTKPVDGRNLQAATAAASLHPGNLTISLPRIYYT